MYRPGDKVFDTSSFLPRPATIVNLRNDAYERLMRQRDPSHAYYHVHYDDDNTFDTYVSHAFLTPNVHTPRKVIV